MNNQNYLSANPLVNKVSFDQFDRYMLIPVKDTRHDLEIPYFTSNHNLEELKNRLCDPNAEGNLGIPFICNPSKDIEEESTDDDHDGDISDKLNKRMEKLKEKLEESLSDGDKKHKSQSEDLQLNLDVESNDGNKDNNKDNDDDNKDEEKQLLEQQLLLQQQEDKKAKDENNGDDEDELGITGLDLKIEKKQAEVNKKIEKLEDKINKENNQLLLEEQDENKAKDQKNKDQNNDEEQLGITGLDLKIEKIQAQIDKKIEKLKDKIENDKDNQRLIEQRDDDNDDDDDGDSKDDGGETYEGYGFEGDNGNYNDDKNFNFATVGDFGCSKNTQNTVANMEKKEPELVLALGDLSYHSTADCWFDTMSPLKGKMMITLGHHDTKDGQAKMNQYIKSFEMDKPYYSYDYKQVHFLVMATLSDYDKGSKQYDFVKQDLEMASQNKDINWIIVSTYKPLYTSPSEHEAENELRELYHPLFEKYGVDLVLGGHNHNYQRTYPLTFNPNESPKPTATNAFTTGYNSNKDGIVFATVGTGGVNFYSLEGRDPYMATQFAGKFGFLNIDISNGNPHSKLTGTFYDNRGSEIADEFTIEKEIKNKNSEVNYS